MNPTSGINLEFERYVNAWAEMMITIWQNKMSLEWVGQSQKPNGGLRYSTGDLKNSFKSEVYRQSGGDVTKIEHAFNYYGIYVDAGIGPEFSSTGRLGKNRNELGQFKETPKRQSKPWFAGKYWYSKNKLFSEMLNRTGRLYMESIRGILTGYR